MGNTTLGLAVVGGGEGGGRLVGDVGENSALFPNSTLLPNLPVSLISESSDLCQALPEAQRKKRPTMLGDFMLACCGVK